jgi:hypothetical protein
MVRIAVAVMLALNFPASSRPVEGELAHPFVGPTTLSGVSFAISSQACVKPS